MNSVGSSPVSGSRAISTAGGAWIALFALTVFLSAFLLFQVQPLIGRYIVPWFGGSYAVWTTTLLFFQVGLLVGYLYAHVIVVRLRTQQQALLHVALLVAALAVLPVIPSEAWRPDDEANPTWRILVLLTVTVGPPYLLLSTTGPLLQRWFAARHPGRSPYPLYAVSNAGSLLALLSYPVVVETFFGLRVQAWAWSAAYAVFVACCAVLAWHTVRGARREVALATPAPIAGAAVVVEEGAPEGGGVTPARVALWVALPACASALLMATTNQLTQDVAALPLLWVLPLALYLLTFIIAFAGDRWYRPGLYRPLAALAFSSAVYALFNPLFSIVWQIPFYCSALFMGALLLHVETVRRRPRAEYLTVFYLAIAVGGALGGFLVAIVAPLVFDGLWEYHLALLGAALLAVAVWGVEVRARGEDRWSEPARGVLLAAIGVVVLGGFLAYGVWDTGSGALAAERNFYGVVRIYEESGDTPEQSRYVMRHGNIVHGLQFLATERRELATGYYGPRSGAGVAIEFHPARGVRPLIVGNVGLGAGMLAVYALPGEQWVSYEINPLVTELAEEYFTFLQDARARGAHVEVRHGDGRRVLERELATHGPRRFDVLVLDAFTGDAIPSHLLTREAFDIYLDHLAPGGVIAVHVSNRHVDLAPVLRGVAAHFGLQAHLVIDESGGVPGAFRSDWVIVTADEAWAQTPAVSAAVSPWADDAREPRLWTDDRHTLYPLLRLY